MKRVLLIILISAFLIPCIFSASQQWEYMIVTFGGTNFSSRDNLTLAYLEEGLNEDVKEANELEENLNILGQHGWELVGITGNIGGDQQLTLKRPYDEAVSTIENKKAEEIQKSADDMYIQNLLEMAPKTFKRELKELDSIEAEETKKKASEDARRLAEEKTEYLKKAMHDSLSKSELEILNEIYRNEQEEGFGIDITLEILLPQRFLINGDSYRKSEIDAYAKQISNLFELKEFEREEGFLIEVLFFLEFDGDYKEVGSAVYSYYYSSYRKKGEWEHN